MTEQRDRLKSFRRRLRADWIRASVPDTVDDWNDPNGPEPSTRNSSPTKVAAKKVAPSTNNEPSAEARPPASVPTTKRAENGRRSEQDPRSADRGPSLKPRTAAAHKTPTTGTDTITGEFQAARTDPMASGANESDGAASTTGPRDLPASNVSKAPVSAVQPDASKLHSKAPASSSSEAPDRSGADATDHPEKARRAEGAARPAMSLVDGTEYFRGATEADILDVWREMRRQFGTNTQNKLRARTTLRDWLQKKREISPDSVIWYGDFFAVRSCAARARRPDEAQGREGWYLAVDPNRAGYRDDHLFHEAFKASSSLTPGAVDELIRPAWISEETRTTLAERAGKGQSRPFVPGALRAADSTTFVAGEVR